MKIYTTHYLHPEKLWGVFLDGNFVAMFGTLTEALEYIDRHTAKKENWTAEEILEREG
jgi:hypothetical protein